MTAAPPRERIAVITTSFPRSPGDAAGHFVLAEVRALQRSADVVVIAAGSSDYAPPDCDVRFVGGASLFDWPGALPRLRENPLRLHAAVRFVRAARTELLDGGPFDRVVAHWIVPCAFPVATGAFSCPFPAKLDVVAHGSDVRLLARFPSLWQNAILARLEACGARLRFVSSALRAELLAVPTLPPKLRGWLEQNSCVSPAALEVPDSLDRNRARALLEISDELCLVVICGRLVQEKRIEVALTAAELVPEASVVVVGGGPLEATLASRFPAVRFVGQLPRERALTWIAAADVLVSASLEEGAPSVVREARALDVPVVARASGDLALWAERDSDLWIV